MRDGGKSIADLTQTFQQALNIPLGTAEILASIVIFAVVAFAGWGIYFVFNRFFSRWARKTETTLDDDIIDAVKSFIVILIIIIGIEFALSPLSFLQPYYATLDGVFFVIEVFLSAFAVTKVSNIVADWYANKFSGPGKNRHHLIFLLKKIIQLAVYISAVIIILWVRQVDLTGMVVGLGVGGIAIAFALQSTLSDFFSAFSIYFDRPFEIGDFIVVSNYSGTVKSIGVKSTRLKLLSGEELVISNKELTSTSVRNFRKLEKRRITFAIGVTYDTPLEKLKKIPPMIAEIIKGVETAEFERAYFTTFGDTSLRFDVSYYVTTSDYETYLKVQQAINFGIVEAFEREGIEIAFPTSTVYVKK
jgi:small-conductance mechanosensitive channel